MSPPFQVLRRLGNAGAQDNARRACEERLSLERNIEALARRLAVDQDDKPVGVPEAIAS
jgi:hypothetical protein